MSTPIPKISIIIPIYNQAAAIGRCLKSIFTQTFIDFEVIIVNDGSADNLEPAIAPWRDKIKLYHQANLGAPAARNFGFKQSVGQYLLFCDADIVMKPEMLEKMYQVLDNNKEAAYTYSSFKFGWKTFKLWPFNENKLKKLPFIHTTSLIRRECFSGFDEKIKRFQDWDLWLTLAENGMGGIWLDEILFQITAQGTISRWRPRMFFKLPFHLREIARYRAAKKIIQEKHHLIEKQ